MNRRELGDALVALDFDEEVAVDATVLRSIFGASEVDAKLATVAFAARFGCTVSFTGARERYAVFSRRQPLDMMRSRRSYRASD